MRTSMELLATWMTAAAVTVSFGCGEDEERQPSSSYSQLAEATSGDLRVAIFTEAPLTVGVNRVQYEITVNGTAVSSATIVQKPLMNMVSLGKTHGCPKVDPGSEANADGRFEGILVFTMATMGTDTWDLSVDVTPAGGQAKATAGFANLPVGDRNVKRTLTVGSGPMAETLILMLDFPKTPVVGINDYNVTVHAKKMMGDDMFPPMSDLTLVATPDMPSMGHGSAGNVDPTYQGNGFYAGKVNFSMSGDWRITLVVSRGGTQLGTVEYTLDL